MADTSTGLAVKSLDTETVRTQIVDAGGTNEAAVSAAGRLSVDASGVAIQIAAGTANIGDVDVLTVPAPLSTTGNGTAATALRVTMASDSTGTVALTGSLPAGTNNIGDVDVLSVIPGVAATNLGKAEDTAHTTGDTGVMVLAVRNDAGTVLSDTTLDYTPLSTDNTGALRVTGGSAGTQYVGDAAATATPTGTMSVGLANAAAPTDVSANNDAVAQWFLRNGSAVVNIAAGGTLLTNIGQTAATGQFARVTDGTTTAGVIVGTTALKTDLSSIAGTAPGATSFVPTRPTDGAAYYTRHGQAVASATFASITDGTLTATVRDTGTSDSLNVAVVDGSGNQITSFGGGTQYTGDAAATATPTGVIAMGLANSAAPADVSANADAVAQWMLRNGSTVTNLASGGTLITIGAKTSAASLPVVLASDQAALAVTGTFWQATQPVSGTVTANAGTGPFPVSDNAGSLTVDAPVGTPVYVRLSDGAANLIGQKAMAASLPVVLASDQSAVASNITQIGGATQSATNPLSIRLTNGTTFLANLGETAATGQFIRITDATNTAAVIATINSLKTDFSSVAGAVASAANPVPVRLTDGAAFYSSVSGAPTLPKFSTKTSSALGAGASVDLTHYVTSGKTGQLTGVDVASTIAMKVVINTELTAAKTARVVLFTPAGVPISWRAPYKTYITQASADATSGFSVTVTNKDTSVAADVYSTGFWDEV